MTQAQLSDFLGDSTPGTVSRWEKDVHEIPHWVEDKMLNSTTVTLPLDALQQLMTLASERRQDFSELLATAIRSMLKQAPAADPPADPPANAA